MTEDEMVERGMAIVRPLIAESGAVVRRAEAMYRDLTGSAIPLHAAEMAEVDRQWWYRRARESWEMRCPCGQYREEQCICN